METHCSLLLLQAERELDCFSEQDVTCREADFAEHSEKLPNKKSCPKAKQISYPETFEHRLD